MFSEADKGNVRIQEEMCNWLRRLHRCQRVLLGRLNELEARITRGC
jgi:hypothetical protein